MPVEVTGVSETIRGMQKTVQGDAIRIADGLARGGNLIFALSQTYVPVDKGPLKASGIVINIGVGFGARTSISYGGESAPYALWVHENMEAFHAHPTCAKWLERAVRESKATLTRLMHRQMSDKKVKTIDGRVV